MAGKNLSPNGRCMALNYLIKHKHVVSCFENGQFWDFGTPYVRTHPNWLHVAPDESDLMILDLHSLEFSGWLSVRMSRKLNWPGPNTSSPASEKSWWPLITGSGSSGDWNQYLQINSPADSRGTLGPTQDGVEWIGVKRLPAWQLASRGKSTVQQGVHLNPSPW